MSLFKKPCLTFYMLNLPKEMKNMEITPLKTKLN